MPLTGDSKLVLYADDVLLFKPICHSDDYIELQTDINAIHQCARKCHLTLNPSKCKVLIASKKRTPLNPAAPLLLDGRPMEQVSNYRYLGVMVTSKLSWSDHIEQICTKARRLVGMLYRQFYCWADILLHCSHFTSHASVHTLNMPVPSGIHIHARKLT